MGTIKQSKCLMVIEPGEGEGGAYYNAYFPDLPGCATAGRTLEQLRANARQAVDLYIQALRDTGQPIPEPAAFCADVEIQAT